MQTDSVLFIIDQDGMNFSNTTHIRNIPVQKLELGKLHYLWDGGAVSGKRFHMVSRIVLSNILEYSFWTPNGILKGKFGGFKIFRPLRIGPSKFFAHYESGRFAHFE